MQRWQACVAALLLAGTMAASDVPAVAAASAVAAPGTQQHQARAVPSKPDHQHKGQREGRVNLLQLVEQDPARAQQMLTEKRARLTQRHEKVQGAIARVKTESAAEKDPARQAVLQAHLDVLQAKVTQLEKQQVLVEKLLTFAAERARTGTGR